MILPTPFCDVCGMANRTQATFCSKCGSFLQASSTLVSNSTTLSNTTSSTGFLLFNHLLKQRYLIIQQIGQGGMGAVYKAEDLQLGKRLVAVKEMSQKGLNPQELVDASDTFKREAHMLAKLQHPNLPSIYDHFFEAGRWYLVMSFIKGETLENYLRKVQGSRLPIQEVFDIGIELCKVLDYLHMCEPAIIFRDLKPANIMRMPNGHLYLIDFGIARHFKSGQAKDTTAFGSPGYAAPEQYGKAQTGPYSDIYSLGALLHQLFSGDDPSQNPFSFAPLAANDQFMVPKIEKLIRQMVEIDTKKRISSVATIKQELLQLRDQLSRTPKVVSPAEPYIHSIALSPIAPVLGTTSPQSETLLAVDYNQSLSPSPVLAATSNQRNIPFIYNGHSNVVWTVAWSPNGQYVASAASDNTVRVWKAPSGQDVYIHSEHSHKVNAVAWSPDGHRIASGSTDKTVQVWFITEVSPIYQHNFNAMPTIGFKSGEKDASLNYNLAAQNQTYTSYPLMTKLTSLLGHVFNSRDQSKSLNVSATPKNNISFNDMRGDRIGTQQSNNPQIKSLIYSGHSSWVSAQAWSPDGRKIASASGDYTVQIWDAISGVNMYTYNVHSGYVQDVAWSPDGQYIASASDDGTVKVLHVASRQIIREYKGHEDKVTSVTWSPDGRRIASASRDSTVQIWDMISSSPLFCYRGHLKGVNGVAWTPNGNYIGSASTDKTIHLWNAATGNHVFTYRGHSEGVICVAWSPRSDMIASSSWDHTVRIWQVV